MVPLTPECLPLASEVVKAQGKWPTELSSKGPGTDWWHHRAVAQ